MRGFPLQAQTPDGQQVTLLGLADARQISEKVVGTHPAAQAILPLMDGSRDLDTIVSEVGRGLTREFLEGLVAQLDDAALLFGPKFEELQRKVREDFDSLEHLPPGTTAAFVEQLVAQATQAASAEQEEGAEPVTPDDLDQRDLFGKILDQWMNEGVERTDAVPIESLPRAIVAPHIDYGRGWINYAAVWGRLRGLDRPDRVVILGTNHFGECSGVCACDKGYETPLGLCELDRELVEAVKGNLGEELSEKLFAFRYDHEREHSVELQVPWIQRTFGPDEQGNYPKVFGVLIHDPAVNGGDSYDGNGVGLDEFVEATRKAIDSLPGRTLVISSADLSHVGPAFGDQERTAGDENKEQAEAFRNKTIEQDKELLEMFAEGRIEDLLAAMTWQQNPTRWCSTGNMIAAMRVSGAESARILNYGAAIDQQGMSMVSNVAMVLE